MKTPTSLSSSHRWDRDFLFDMIAEMAKMARRAGDMPVAIHLEALLAVKRFQERPGGLPRH